MTNGYVMAALADVCTLTTALLVCYASVLMCLFGALTLTPLVACEYLTVALETFGRPGLIHIDVKNNRLVKRKLKVLTVVVVADVIAATAVISVCIKRVTCLFCPSLLPPPPPPLPPPPAPPPLPP